MTGPGAPPAHAHAAYLTPGAIWTVTSFSTRFTFATGPAGAAGKVAGNGWWAAARASAFAGAAPAKLPVAAVCAIVAGAPALTLAAAAWASSRAFCADEAIQIPIGIIRPSARPAK